MVTIVIKPKHIERAIYIPIIIILATLLVLSYLNGSSYSSSSSEDTPTESALEETNTTTVVEPVKSELESESKSGPEPEPKETCDDNIKNQDETAVDCGGTCTSVNGAYYYNGGCHIKDKVTAKTSLSVIDVGYSAGKSTSAKLEEVKVSITNGEGSNKNFMIEVYAMDRYGTNYLNQLDGTYRGDPLIVESVVLGNGQTTTKTIDMTKSSSPYLLQNDYYSAGEPFMIEVVMTENGNTIKEAQSKLITP